MNKELYRETINKKIIDIEIKDEKLSFIFDDGKDFSLEYHHDQDCCESVYADFTVIKYYKDEIIGKTVKDVLLKEVSDMGFLICFYWDWDSSVKVFIPCYNYQNGYYSSDLELIINGQTKIDISGLVEDHID